MLKFKLIFVLAAATLLMGCPPKQPNSATTSGDLTTTGDGLDAGAQTVGDSTITQRELDALRDNFKRVHFDFDSATLEETSREILKANAEILVNHPDVRVRVEGHADHWGSDIYNLALGQRRAYSVTKYLTDLGVLTNQLEVISYGEERPLVGDMDRESEAPNRRAEFLVIVSGEANEVGSSY